MNIFITGGAGFIGSHIAEEYLKEGHVVSVYDNFSTGKRENLLFGAPGAENLKVIEGDIRDFDKLIWAIEGQDIIFHEAAVASVQKSIDNPLETFDVNARGTLHVLEAARRRGVRKVLFACSAAIFGDDPELPKKEDSPVRPISPYGSDKYTSECYLRLYSQLFGLPTVSLRYFNVFGPRQDPSSPYSGVISIFIDRVMKGAGLTIFGDGRQYRDFIYVKDVVRVNMLAAEKAGPPFARYNVGYGIRTSLNDLVAMLSEITGRPIDVAFKEARLGDILESVTDNAKIREDLGFRPSFTVREGLRELIGYKG